VVIQDDKVKRILPRYEQMSSLNVNNIFIFAMETPLHSFQQASQLNRANSAVLSGKDPSAVGDKSD
jgi:hypothetical protein